MNFSFAAANKALGRLMPTRSPATYAILGLSCLFYLASLLWTLRLGGSVASGGGLFGFDIGVIDDRVLQVLGASLPWQINLGEPWRFVMAVFLHGSLLHIGFNMWVLMDIGPLVEELYGSARYLFIYVVTGIGGYVLSSAFGRYAVGGSGALLGLVGVLLAMTMGHKSVGMVMLRQQLIRWLIYIGIMSLLPGISLLAHAGGFATGFALGKVLKDRPPVNAEERRTASVFGWASALLVVLSIAMMARHFLQGS